MGKLYVHNNRSQNQNEDFIYLAKARLSYRDLNDKFFHKPGTLKFRDFIKVVRKECSDNILLSIMYMYFTEETDAALVMLRASIYEF